MFSLIKLSLAVHMVAIKGVFTFWNTSVEYSDLDIMQMLGRAVRASIDTILQ